MSYVPGCLHDLLCLLFLFFFQAEDGIRDDLVTGVQTYALPISPIAVPASTTSNSPWSSKSSTAARISACEFTAPAWAWQSAKRLSKPTADASASPANWDMAPFSISACRWDNLRGRT